MNLDSTLELQRQISSNQFIKTTLELNSMFKQLTKSYSVAPNVRKSQSNMALSQKNRVVASKKERKDNRDKSNQEARSFTGSNSQRQKPSQLNKKLFDQIHAHKRQIIKLHTQNQELKQTISEMKSKNKSLQKQIFQLKMKQHIESQKDEEDESIAQLVAFEGEEAMFNAEQTKQKFPFDLKMIIKRNQQPIESNRYGEMEMKLQKLKATNNQFEYEITEMKNQLKTNQQSKVQIANQKKSCKDDSTQTVWIDNSMIQSRDNSKDLTSSSRQIQLQSKIQQLQSHIKDVSRHHNYLKDKCHTIRYLIKGPGQI